MHFKITRRLDYFIIIRILRVELSCQLSSENVAKSCSVLALLLVMIFFKDLADQRNLQEAAWFRITLSEKDADHSIQIWEQIHDLVIFVNTAFDRSAYILSVANKPRELLNSIQIYFKRRRKSLCPLYSSLVKPHSKDIKQPHRPGRKAAVQVQPKTSTKKIITYTTPPNWNRVPLHASKKQLDSYICNQRCSFILFSLLPIVKYINT